MKSDEITKLLNQENTVVYKKTGADSAESNNKSVSSGKWKKVVIGGVSGIVLGSVAEYAALASEDMLDGSDSIDDAVDKSVDEMLHSVDDEMSFEEAFAAARADLGPGGVFAWRGNMYNTYTSEEWESLQEQSQEDEYQSGVEVLQIQDELDAELGDEEYEVEETETLDSEVEVYVVEDGLVIEVEEDFISIEDNVADLDDIMENDTLDNSFSNDIDQIV